MVPYRMTRHRVCDATGKDRQGLAAISTWWVARAAAEETLQGSPLVAAWLKLFREHLSDRDRYWLRWRGDIAESAELRRAYSGIYGRFFARALMTQHLGLSRFLSLERGGLQVSGSVEVRRVSSGDIPDWIAWDDHHSRFVLCEAKGSLTARDFLGVGGPKCAQDGKAQFGRVATYDGTAEIHPAQWVAATRWATDKRAVEPITLLWDPPVDDEPMDNEAAARHREAMTRAWLDSLAPGLGWSGADALISEDRAKEALVIRADPGPIPEEEDWPSARDGLFAMIRPELRGSAAVEPGPDTLEIPDKAVEGKLADVLGESDIYADRSLLSPKEHETQPHEGAYIAALITPFGVRPIRSNSEFEDLRRERDRALRLEQPAMVVGIPFRSDPKEKRSGKTWMDGAGIAQSGELAVFDLRRITVQPLEPRSGR